MVWEDPEAELISVRLKRIRSELETVRQLRVTTSVPVRPPAYDALQIMTVDATPNAMGALTCISEGELRRKSEGQSVFGEH